MQPTIPPNKASKRRAQNASAQRTYRAKQKQRIQRLEALTIAALASSPSSSSSSLVGRGHTPNINQHHETQAQTSQLPTTSILDQSGRPSTTPSTTARLDFARLQALLRACTPRERQTFHIIVMRERFGLRDIIKYGLIRLGHAMDASLFERARHASPRAWIAQVRAALGESIDILAVLAAGVRLLASFPLPEALLASSRNGSEAEEEEEEVIRRVVFAPRQAAAALRDQVTLSAVALGAALFANALVLGIPLAAMASDDDDAPLRPQALRGGIPADLVPTAAQRAVPHHPSLDVMPWPAFRENVCAALARDPPGVDDDELCLDLLNDGVRCWGGGGRGMGAPWDSRSWEAAPWFLEKWEGLAGGREGEMWKGSEWWRAMRS
ncbi:hypothetical protein GGS24DRAFT_511080 [Hypoxylon argillaceum]|nr:hypothetical protein GGS24DRAFT_511080 [Hypoxylon argillaceum]